MDFTLIERHPWVTTGVVIGGGVILFLVMRRGGSTAAPAGSSGLVYASADPAQTQGNIALEAQQQQGVTALQGLTVQANTQLALAGISGDIQRLGIAASQEVTDRQTMAQLDLGIGSIQSQVDLARINAETEQSWIAALVSSLGGGPKSAGGNTIVQYTGQITPPIPVSVAPPTPQTNSQGGPITGNSPGGAVIPGGQQLVPIPNYTPVGAWPNPVAIAENQRLNVQWEDADVQANKVNNFNGCMADAQRSAGYSNYDSLVAACHSNYGM